MTAGTEAAIRISEIFGPTIQGEGALIGRPTVFVRTGGCDYRCSWCDTPHAVDSRYRHDWTPMSAEHIFARVQDLSRGKPLTVSLSGGNPALQNLGPLIALGTSHGYSFALETQGSVAQDWFSDLDVLTLSPKPPSSLMTCDETALAACIAAAKSKPRIVLKYIVFDEADYQFARRMAALYPAYPTYLQPGNHTPPGQDQIQGPLDMDGIMARMRWLVGRVVEDAWFEAVVLPQLHVLLWGNKRGV